MLRPRPSKDKAAAFNLSPASVSTRAATSANSEGDLSSPPPFIAEEDTEECKVTEDHLRTPFVSILQSNAESGARGVGWHYLFPPSRKDLKELTCRAD